MEELLPRVARGELVHDVRRLLAAGADAHLDDIRANLRLVMQSTDQDVVAISTLTGVAPGTVRGFLGGRPSSIRNVALMAMALGVTLAELGQSPQEFRAWFRGQGADVRPALPSSHGVGDLAASLIAFEQSTVAMAVILMDGRLVKANRALRELLGYEEGELMGMPVRQLLAHPEDGSSERQAQLFATDALPAQQLIVRRKDGYAMSLSAWSILVRDAEGVPRYVVARAVPTG